MVGMMNLLGACDFFSVPNPLFAFSMSVLMMFTTLFTTIQRIVVGTTNCHLLADAVASNHLKLGIYIVRNITAVHFACHFHRWAAELQFDAVARRLMANQLISVHLLKMIVLRSQLRVVLVE